MTLLDELQRAWQSQSCGSVSTSPDELLTMARLERRGLFWVDMLLISVFVLVGLFMLHQAIRDVHEDWPWLISAASDAWVAGYILFNRWRRGRFVARYDESLLAHIEWSIKDMEHRMRVDAKSLWWYVLPIALGCMIPPVCFFAMDYGRRPLSDALVPLLVAEAIFAVIFYLVHRVMKYGRHLGLEGQQRKLQSLRSLRETLLDTDKEIT